MRRNRRRGEVSVVKKTLGKKFRGAISWVVEKGNSFRLERRSFRQNRTFSPSKLQLAPAGLQRRRPGWVGITSVEFLENMHLPGARVRKSGPAGIRGMRGPRALWPRPKTSLVQPRPGPSPGSKRSHGYSGNNLYIRGSVSSASLSRGIRLSLNDSSSSQTCVP